MSYDLMVFEPAAAPADRAGFEKWYEKQTEWGEGHSYNDEKFSTPALRAWFLEFILQFPAMNGPHANHDDDSAKVTDYSVGKSVIYAAFAWSEADNAYKAMFATAKKHGLGFFDVSSNEGEVWMMDAKKEYVCVHRK